MIRGFKLVTVLTVNKKRYTAQVILRFPQDARDYDKALLWRGISYTVGFTADSKAKWSGALKDFLGVDSSLVKVEVDVAAKKTA